MPVSVTRIDRVREAAGLVLDEAAADHRFQHTSHLQVRLGGEVVVDEHRHGPLRNDVFSITKTVLAAVLGVMAARNLLPALDDPIADALPGLGGTPARLQTWRHLLTMTRGAAVDGPWDVDEVTAMTAGQVAHIAAAPQLHPPGQWFGYDNGAAHLLAAAATSIIGEPVSQFAARELFEPLGIQGAKWAADPDGIPFGYAHLRLSADDLGRIGQLLLDGGRAGTEQLLDPSFVRDMLRPHSAGGPPEQRPYGYLIWIDDTMPLAGGWAGQHVLVVPEADAVIVITGDPHFDLGPPPRDDLPPDWAPALGLVRAHLLPILCSPGH